MVQIANLASLATVLLVFDLTSGTKHCSVERYGKLKTFVGERANVDGPCKYRVADITCGDYSVRVTAGSQLEEKNRFSPATVWVRVVDTTNDKFWIARTSQRLVENATESDAVWSEKEGNLALTTAGFDDEIGRGAAVVAQAGVFQVVFDVAGGNRGVHVRCHLPDQFSSAPYPETLCGDPTEGKVFKDRRRELFGLEHEDDDTVAQMVLYDVLNNKHVTQSKTCRAIAREFRTCPDERRARAALVCGPVFGVRALAKCLMTSRDDVQPFADCVTSVCHPGIAHACLNLKQNLQERCGADERQKMIPQPLAC